MIRFNANLFRLAFTCSSNEATRFYLRGVYVEPHAQGGVTLTATDGHRLICIRDESGSADESAIINLGDGLKQCKPKRNETRFVIVDGQNASIVAEHDGASGSLPIAMAYNVKVDGTYPDYRRVVPSSFTKEGAPGFQGRYVAAFGDVAGELALHMGLDAKDSHNNVLRIFCGGDGKQPEGSPALITFPAFDFAFGILMPVRIATDTPLAAPAWFRDLPAPMAQAAE